MLSEDRLYVDFAVEATAVHLQVFMTFTDGEWRISSDADGNVQIFEVTALYNYVGNVRPRVSFHTVHNQTRLSTRLADFCRPCFFAWLDGGTACFSLFA